MSTRQSARDRLIDTASTLFYDRGLPNVGINEVTDRAGVARMTLYNNFPSKEALALAAFERRADERRQMIEASLAAASTPLEALEAMYDVAEQLATRPRFRGCAFINVAAQDPDPDGKMHALVRMHKDWIRAQFHDIAARAGHKSPEAVAQQCLALWDGGLLQAYIQGTAEPIEACRQAASILLRSGVLADV